MNKHNKKSHYTTFLLFTALAWAVSVTPAAMATEHSEGYWIMGGRAVFNPYGECWRTSYWNQSMATEECDPSLVEQAALETVPTSTTRKISLSAETHFAFDQAILTDEGKHRLDEIADAMGRTGDRTLVITGYADRIGTEAYNLDLSKRRAQVVEDYLVSRGMRADRIDLQGKGEADPVVACEGQRGVGLIDCLAPNRRTEVEFSALEVLEEQ